MIRRIALELVEVRSISKFFTRLISKVENSFKLNQFCPISLCKVLYKALTKILAHRLREVMPQLVSLM